MNCSIFEYPKKYEEKVVYLQATFFSENILLNRTIFGEAYNNNTRAHNILSKKGYTVKYRPWVVIHVEVFSHKKEAMTREAFLKSGAGRRWLDLNISSAF